MSLFELIKSQVIPELKNMTLSYLSKYFQKEIKLLRQIGFSGLNILLDPHYFIHVPKCGGNSIKKYLIENNLPTIILGHSTFYPFYKFPYEISKKNNPKAFCIVRNPFDRIVSAYSFLKKGGMNFMDSKVYDEYLREYNNFHDFVLKGLGNEKNRKRIINKVIHMIPQTKFLIDKKGNLCLLKENIIHLEELQEEFSRYLNSRGQNLKDVPWENKTCAKNNYKEKYKNPEGKIMKDLTEIITTIYKEDFNELGYSQDIE